jgi:hypothetical protein
MFPDVSAQSGPAWASSYIVELSAVDGRANPNMAGHISDFVASLMKPFPANDILGNVTGTSSHFPPAL